MSESTESVKIVCVAESSEPEAVTPRAGSSILSSAMDGLVCTAQCCSCCCATKRFSSVTTLLSISILVDVPGICDAIWVTGIPSHFPVVFTCFTDLHLSTFDLGPKAVADRLRGKKALRCDTSLLVLAHGEQTLFCGDREGGIVLLDIPTMLSLTGGFEHANSGVIRAHTKAVTGLVLLPGSSVLSSAMDGLVCTLLTCRCGGATHGVDGPLHGETRAP